MVQRIGKIAFPDFRRPRGQEPGTEGCEPRMAPVPGEVARLFDSCSETLDGKGYSQTDLCFMHLFVLAGHDSGLVPLVGDLSGSIGSVTHFTDCASALQCMRRVEQPEIVFAADIAAFGTVDSAVEDLMALRSHNPGLATMILSRDFVRHDFSDTRKAIADCSLRLPATIDAIETGLHVALTNAQHGMTLR